MAVRPSGAVAEQFGRTGVLKAGRLLLKRVAAVRGDRVCRIGRDISINANVVAAAALVTPDREPLPDWQGCAVLGDGEVFLLGDAQDSFDGRYFGVTSGADIVGSMIPVLTF